MTHVLSGRKQSPEHIAKRVQILHSLGVYQKFGKQTSERNKARKGIPLSEDHKKNISDVQKGNKYCLGHVPSLEHRQKLADYWSKNKEKHNHYKDGLGAERTSARQVDMGRLEYRLWREGVFKRDNWTCVRCYQHGGSLQADHIKLYSEYPDLRYVLSNGRTLCKLCHLTRNKWELPV